MPTIAIGSGVLVVPIVGTLTANSVLAAVLCAAAAMGLGVLLAVRRVVFQTTLAGPWWWSLAAVIGWAGVELAGALGGINTGHLEALRLSAISLSFCPMVAVLGAKRPQNGAWNFVVLSLWGIVALPAAENFFLHPGQRLMLGDARAWFLWVLILLGPINYVPTRFRVASLWLAAGQVVALSPYLALIHRPLFSHYSPVGLLIAINATRSGWIAARWFNAGTRHYDRCWLNFRDSFGLLWALRVQERVNAVARQNGWDIELNWSGFCRTETGEGISQIDLAIEPALKASFNGLLRRFVSSEWISDRV
jgi:hypothetical protein